MGAELALVDGAPPAPLVAELAREARLPVAEFNAELMELRAEEAADSAEEAAEEAADARESVSEEASEAADEAADEAAEPAEPVMEAISEARLEGIPAMAEERTGTAARVVPEGAVAPLHWLEAQATA